MDDWQGQRGGGSGGGRGRGRGGGRGRGRGGRRGGRTLGRGSDGTPRNQPELTLGFGELQALEKKSSDEIILQLTSSRGFPATEYLLNQQSVMEGHWIVLIVSIVRKACDCSSKEALLKLLNLLRGSSFLNLQLRPYLNKLSANSLPPCDVAVFLRSVFKIMRELLRRFPSCYADLPVPDLYCGTKRLSDTGQLADGALVREVDELIKLRSKKAEELKRKEEAERQKRKPRRDAEMNDDVDPPGNFRWLSVVPTQEDILQEGRPFLRRNKIDGSYNDAEHYLDVQFRLLREDFMRPLREGIAQLLERMGSASTGALQSLQDIRVYSNVQLLYPVCTANGIRYRIKFDNSKLRHVRWENSKRLIFGSLICLSKDKFESFVLATVADRELWDIRRGILDIQVLRVYDQARLEEGDVYQMVESTAFFEAYRHVLEGLKETDPAELPFQKYIVNCQKEVEPPPYIKEHGTFDLTPIMKNACRTPTASTATPLQRQKSQSSLGLDTRDAAGKGASILLLNLASWPSAEDLGLDDSQFKALQMALTKEFAVIQGPPGTGKTYLGLKIANVLLHNKEKRDSGRAFRLHTDRFGQRVSSGHCPILVVCYTNHALDQFLEGIHKFHSDGIVRVGGRSQSETMKECSLSELRHKMYQNKKVPDHIRSAISNARKKMELTQSKVNHAACRLQRCHEDVLHEDELLNHAQSMTAAHYESLKRPFVEAAKNNESCIVHWLQLSMDLANPKQGVVDAGGEHTGAEAEARVEDEEAEEEDDVNNHNPDVRYEADVIQDQRILNDDDNYDDVDDGHSSKSASKKEELYVVDPTVVSSESEDGWKIQNAYRLRRKIKRIIKREVSKKNVMPDERARMVTDVWSLSVEGRWSLYRRWLIDVRQLYRRTISDHQYEFNWDVMRLKEEKEKLDLNILIGSDVIGMTTTGAAKYRKLLQQLRPQITIVEEAAEVLESHIVTSLTPGCQHVILIGDHQQLRPNPTVYELAKHYNLDVSLFERMVKNGVPFTRLRLQHRMRPEISKMLEHIYFDPKLKNHKSVMKFDNIKGVARNVFFVDHEETEDFTREGKSRSNEHEAKFMAALCRYFILQGYEREQITVLTAYVGQLTQIKKELVPNDFFTGVRVCAVDNFQGEENDIILLSLVRSNEEGKIGFLQIENRVCVALSRAKKGFFCIGNISLLEAKSILWRKVIKDMRERENVGKALKLKCQNHPQNVSHASCADDFKTCAPEGGCTVKCAKLLKCGHVCEMFCHPTDPEHENYDCKKPCTKEKTQCPLIQKYSGKYYQACRFCMKSFRENHLQGGPCYICKNLSKMMCLSVCLKTWPCGHEHKTKCHVDPLLASCKAPCGVTLKCGHPCPGNCSVCWRGRVHEPCEAKCDRTLYCGHKCSGRCNETCPPCKECCSNYCKHYRCYKKCAAPCEPCNRECLWQCQHYTCTKLCGELCDRPRCNLPCTKLLRCGHPCIGLCGEVCPKKCRTCHKQEVTENFFGTEGEPNARFVELADCGHVFEVRMMDQWMDQAETTPDGKPVNVQLKLCPKCSVPIRTSLRYGNIIKKILADFERIKQKILLRKDQRGQEVARLKLKLQEIDKFPKYKNVIGRMLGRKNLSDEQINVIDNQISMLSFLQKLKADIVYFKADERSQETKEDLDSKVEQLQKRVIWLRFQFSDQIVEELGEEMYRTQLLIDFKMLKMQLDIRGINLGVTDTVKVDFVKEAFDSENTIDKKRRERYRARIERIRREQGLQELCQTVRREEKDLTVKAMVLTQLQGHWFKCPNGHIYCITECGGALEESKCPECSSRIGGHNQQS